MRSGNPALNDSVFVSSGTMSDKMTISGTVFKTYILTALLLAGFAFTWSETTQGYSASFQQAMQAEQMDAEGKKLPTQIDLPSNVIGYAMVGCFGGFILGMMVIFNPQSAPYLSPIYAVLEGMALGAVSAGFEAKYPGIAIQAAGVTFGTLGGLLILYTTGLVKATENFALGLLAAMFGILAVYLLDIIFRAFGMYTPVTELTHGNSLMSIGFSAFIVVVAALNLVLDFDFIEDGAAKGAPKYMEWYGAFGLMVTLVWLYLEIIRLLAKIRSNDD